MRDKKEIESIINNSEDLMIRSDVAKMMIDAIENDKIDDVRMISYVLSYILSTLLDIEEVLNHGD